MTMWKMLTKNLVIPLVKTGTKTGDGSEAESLEGTSENIEEDEQDEYGKISFK